MIIGNERIHFASVYNQSTVVVVSLNTLARLGFYFVHLTSKITRFHTSLVTKYDHTSVKLFGVDNQCKLKWSRNQFVDLILVVLFKW